MQDTDKGTAGGERADVGGHRHEDHCDGRFQLLQAGGDRCLVVDDPAVAAGFYRFLPDVHRRSSQVFGTDLCDARSQDIRLQDFQREGLSDHRLYDQPRHRAQAYSGHSDLLLRLVLLRTGPRPAFGRYPLPDSLAAGPGTISPDRWKLSVILSNLSCPRTPASFFWAVSRRSPSDGRCRSTTRTGTTISGG